MTNLLERYAEPVSLRLSDSRRLRRLRTQPGRVILALDGLQPDVGHAVLWVLRDCLSGAVWSARSLLRHLRRPSQPIGKQPGAIRHLRKVTRSYWPGRFHGYAVADLPRTYHGLPRMQRLGAALRLHTAPRAALHGAPGGLSQSGAARRRANRGRPGYPRPALGRLRIGAAARVGLAYLPGGSRTAPLRPLPLSSRPRRVPRPARSASAQAGFAAVVFFRAA